MNKYILMLMSFQTLLLGCKNEEIITLENDINDEVADILISEILPDPKKDGVEFVEIYNNSTKVIDLNFLQLATSNSNGKRSKLHLISNSSKLMYPFTYKLLSLNSEIVQSHYPFQDPITFHEMASFPTLTNSQGAVILFRNEQVIDSLFYNVSMHDVFIKNSKGVSLERVSFTKPTNSPGNFISAAASIDYATPGYINSQSENKITTNHPIFLSSKIFAPAKKEQLEINFNFKEGGKMANLFIYNKSGKRVRTLLKNHRLGTKECILWKGEDDNEKLLSVGVYHLFIEIFDAKGNLLKYKESCVLANKQ